MFPGPAGPVPCECAAGALTRALQKQYNYPAAMRTIRRRETVL